MYILLFCTTLTSQMTQTPPPSPRCLIPTDFNRGRDVFVPDAVPTTPYHHDPASTVVKFMIVSTINHLPAAKAGVHCANDAPLATPMKIHHAGEALDTHLDVKLLSFPPCRMTLKYLFNCVVDLVRARCGGVKRPINPHEPQLHNVFVEHPVSFRYEFYSLENSSEGTSST